MNVKPEEDTKPVSQCQTAQKEQKPIQIEANEEEEDEEYKLLDNILVNHPSIKPIMRIKLLDWLMESCALFCFTRTTYYLSQDLVDRFLSKTIDFPINQFQKLGITSLFIAHKIEEVKQRGIIDLHGTTDNCCTLEEMFLMEKEIMQVLNYYLTPTTLNYWLNYYLFSWDAFQQTDDGVCFIKNDQYCYKRYSAITQILDCVTLDSRSLTFNKKHIVLAIIYLMYGLTVQSISKNDVVKIASIEFFDDKRYNLNVEFDQFLFTERLNINHIISAIKYVGQFFILQIQHKLPQEIIQNPNLLEEKYFSYEQFIAYQIFNNQSNKLATAIIKQQ